MRSLWTEGCFTVAFTCVGRAIWNPLERLDVLLKLGPAWESILAGNLDLGVSEGCSCSGADEIPGLVAKMSEIRAFGKLHGEILSSARCPHVRAKGVSHKTKFGKVGLLPFPRTGCVPHARPMIAPEVKGVLMNAGVRSGN